MSLRGLADELDVTHSFIQKIENCERRLDELIFAYICLAAGIEPSQIIKKLYE
ncbi:hypothetical protein [Alkalimarinus coralli]|uniref:hypothetical protein n=1 Tax=Alkalimarinus coralli TaxID=2935863 RepID=UPI003B8A6D8D